MDLFSKGAKVHNSDESLITAILPKSDLNLDNGKNDESKKSVIISEATDADNILPAWILHLPNTVAVLWVIFFIVVPFLWIYCNGIERPVATNPCNTTDPKTFQSFVATWKEKNNTKISYKIFVEQSDDMPLSVKENYEKEIQAATDKIWFQTLTDNLDYRRYKKCFSDNNQSKLNFITYICVTNYVVFNIALISCFFFVDYYCTQLKARKTIACYSLKAKETAFKYCQIYPPADIFMNIMLYRILSENTVSTDFIF
jgi:hypothetical protein